ncbi:MAG: MotA/TolQ/ExbB proton channel family protein [Bacillota bacterium]
MDITSIVGNVLAIVLLVSGIGIARVGNFIDPGSLLIVAFGTMAAIIIAFPLEVLKQVPKHMKIMFLKSPFEPMYYIDQLEEMAVMARKNGLLALEEKANDMEDPFMQTGLMLIVDATAPEKVKEFLDTDLENTADRHAAAIALYSKAGEFAPGLGMIGTLIGLINMLMGLDLTAGPGNLTGDMGVAMITTFYGSVMANLMFLPMANKLSLKNDDELLCKQIIIEGVLAIQEGENPKFLKEKLIAFLPNHMKNADKKGGGEE